MIGEFGVNRLKREYRAIHSDKKVGRMIGDQVIHHVWEIQDLTFKFPGGNNLLDFGCGKRYAYIYRKINRLWDVNNMVYYDLGIKGIDRLPDQSEFNCLISIDVLEHIPEEEIDDIFQYWYHKDMKFVYATIAAYPAVAKLADGSNAHVNQKEWFWWENKIRKHITCDTLICYQPQRSPKTWQYHYFDVKNRKIRLRIDHGKTVLDNSKNF